MRFFIINSDYPQFTRSLYDANPGLAQASYDEQLSMRNAELFGVSDFYPARLNELGHQAMEVHINNFTMQSTWAREHNFSGAYKITAPHMLPVLGNRWQFRSLRQILLEQVKAYKPDVILTHDYDHGNHRFYKELKKHARMLVYQVASPVNWNKPFDFIDLALSSLPSFVEKFRSKGVRSELFRLGFDPVVLQKLPQPERDVDISFVGSISAAHSGRTAWLEQLCRELPVKVWGEGLNTLPANSPIRNAYQGPAWGADMFKIMMRSKITLNYHINIAGNYANNMRLYESTGCGACLLTDDKINIRDMFIPDQEVAVYRTTDECIKQAKALLDDPQKRISIGQLGQARTLRDHTYAQRMAELVALVESSIHH